MSCSEKSREEAIRTLEEMIEAELLVLANEDSQQIMSRRPLRALIIGLEALKNQKDGE